MLREVKLYYAIEATAGFFPRDPTILRGFLNYWSSVTNSFHLPQGEMSITLWDLKMMAGLPICGGYYHEYIPSDEELSGFKREGDRKAYHSEACLELFNELQQFDCITKIHYEDWSVYFSHGLK